jgi:hypothetical protein
MSRLCTLVVLCGLMTAVPVGARQAPQVPPPAAPTAPSQGRTPTPAAAPTPVPQPSYLGAHSNVRVELTIAETLQGATTNKNVVLITSDNHKGSIRSNMQSAVEGPVILNVDAYPVVQPDGRVSLDLVFVYTPQRSQDANTAGAHSTDIQEQMNVVLNDGKPLVVSQSADPRGDRKVTVEVTATILK